MGRPTLKLGKDTPEEIKSLLKGVTSKLAILTGSCHHKPVFSTMRQILLSLLVRLHPAYFPVQYHTPNCIMTVYL